MSDDEERHFTFLYEKRRATQRNSIHINIMMPARRRAAISILLRLHYDEPPFTEEYSSHAMTATAALITPTSDELAISTVKSPHTTIGCRARSASRRAMAADIATFMLISRARRATPFTASIVENAKGAGRRLFLHLLATCRREGLPLGRRRGAPMARRLGALDCSSFEFTPTNCSH